MKRFLMIFTMACFAMGTLAAAAASDDSSTTDSVVNLYTQRYYDADQDIFDQFTAETGIEVRVVQANADELIQRILAEGNQSEADIFMTVDVARLTRAVESGILSPLPQESLLDRVPPYLQDRDGLWVSLTKRARVAVYNPETIDPAKFQYYEQLGSADFPGTVLTRSSGNVYSQSLFSAYIAHNGLDAGLEWAQGIVSNLAREPKGNDRDQIRAVAAGEGDVAIVNTYYLGLLANSDDPADRQVADSVAIAFPRFEQGGTHVNVSGAGIVQSAPNRENAERLLRYLLSDEVQRSFAQNNYEYPVVAGVADEPLVASWGSFTEDTLPLSRVGDHQVDAVRLFDQANWK